MFCKNILIRFKHVLGVWNNHFCSKKSSKKLNLGLFHNAQSTLSCQISHIFSGDYNFFILEGPLVGENTETFLRKGSQDQPPPLPKRSSSILPLYFSSSQAIIGRHLVCLKIRLFSLRKSGCSLREGRQALKTIMQVTSELKYPQKYLIFQLYQPTFSCTQIKPLIYFVDASPFTNLGACLP